MRAVKRLRVIADLINDDEKVVADIGCDHGYLSKILINENRAKQVIATDISKPSLEKTAILASRYGINDKIITKVGDGLKPIENENVDIVVIAGMGGFEIIKILQDNKKTKYSKLIFQPVQNSIELRSYLIKNNYKILKDFIIEDKGKFYNTLVVEFNNQNQILNSEEVEFGLTNFDLKSKDFYNYLLFYINKYENIKKHISSKDGVDEKIMMAKKIITKLYGENGKGE